jgi:hypothetical protein
MFRQAKPDTIVSIMDPGTAPFVHAKINDRQLSRFRGMVRTLLGAVRLPDRKPKPHKHARHHRR